MKRTLVYTVAFSLVAAALIPAAWATGRPNDAKVSHLVDSTVYPDSATVQNATHQFEVHVQGKALSELSIDLPEEVSITNGIEVKNKSGQKIPATVSINDRKATVVFSQPVAPETMLSVSLQGVQTPGYDQTWLYRFYAKKVGLTAEIPLGTARIQTYRG
ncbi:hypothetical protein NIES2119_17825 [[Phormidium ambiguum] IAM M-71]|uniref:DUF2808 domain-containing protein n=2 Tax=Floridanema TaxID=3396149 RepID=A0A1U7IGP8_9CYAN|nr:DUF2808 domain-containing protein [Phormidium ambiguum]OKH36175.1 hypothetical protein NIES2119_17825 [Phormidium ambiguum IAM M-71]